MQTGLQVQDLEIIYDALAMRVDQAGEKSELFLAKLSLLLADQVGNRELVLASIDSAAKDL